MSTDLLRLYSDYKRGKTLSSVDSRRLNTAIGKALSKYALQGDREMWSDLGKGIQLSPMETEDLEDSITEALAIYSEE